MRKGRRTGSVKGQQGIVHARFLAVVFLFVLLGLYGVLYAVGIARELPPVFWSAGKTMIGEVSDRWAVMLGVVKIECGDFRGSGVVIAQDEDGLVVVSAKHLLMYDVRASVSFAGMGDAESKGSVIGYSASYDLAYLYVPFSELSSEAAEYDGAGADGNGCAEKWSRDFGALRDASDMAWNVEVDGNGQQVLIRTDDAYRELRAGDAVIQTGLSENSELEYYAGTAQAKEVFIGDYNAFMLLNECYAEAGMSGGGAFDENGRLVGIIIAGDAQGTVCMPMTTVLAEYRALGE